MGTKNSVDDLLPKSDELLTQTQRQERAISEIHADLRLKTNKIIENLEGVESRLRKQEDDVATLSQRPISAELLLDPTIDRLVEYDPSRLVFKLQSFNIILRKCLKIIMNDKISQIHSGLRLIFVLKLLNVMTNFESNKCNVIYFKIYWCN